MARNPTGQAIARRMESARAADAMRDARHEQTVNDGNAQNVATLKRQLHEAREALRIVRDMAENTAEIAHDAPRAAFVRRMIMIRQACAIGLHRASDDFTKPQG